MPFAFSRAPLYEDRIAETRRKLLTEEVGKRNLEAYRPAPDDLIGQLEKKTKEDDELNAAQNRRYAQREDI